MFCYQRMMNIFPVVIKKSISLPLFRRASKNKEVSFCVKVIQLVLWTTIRRRHNLNWSETYASTKAAPSGAFQDHTCLHVILAKVCPNPLLPCNSNDNPSSKITLLLVLIRYFSLWQLYFSCMSWRPTSFSQSGCLRFDACMNFERVVTNRNTRFAAAVHLFTLVLGSLSKGHVDDSKNVIWKCNFVFLHWFLNYSKSLRLQNVC